MSEKNNYITDEQLIERLGATGTDYTIDRKVSDDGKVMVSIEIRTPIDDFDDEFSQFGKLPGINYKPFGQ